MGATNEENAMSSSSTGKPAAPRKRAIARTATKKAVKPAGAIEEGSRGSKNILTAGIKALTNAHEEAVARQSRVFESLLGMGKSRGARQPADQPSNPLAAAAMDPFGFKKFEDVFDQRVVRTLQRMGYPSPEAHAELVAEVDALRAQVAALRTSGTKR
jgi:hypothetical protein